MLEVLLFVSFCAVLILSCYNWIRAGSEFSDTGIIIRVLSAMYFALLAIILLLVQ